MKDEFFTGNKIVDFYNKNKKKSKAVYRLEPFEDLEEVRGKLKYYFYDRDLETDLDLVKAQGMTERGEMDGRAITVFIKAWGQ